MTPPTKKRELKFRAWDKKEKRMIVDANEGVKIYLNGSISDKKGWANVDLELMQFTGLLDKNGKEIYEGDILRNNLGKNEFGSTNQVDGPVFFDEDVGSFCVELLAGNELIGIVKLAVPDPFEVIGNIYENPELLK